MRNVQNNQSISLQENRRENAPSLPPVDRIETNSAGSAQSTNSKPERLHYLDWLRALIVLGVFYAHNVDIADFLDWNSRYKEHGSGVLIVGTLISQAGMSLFFLLAGASSWFSLRSRTGKQFVRERFRRLVIPFLIGVIILSPPQAYLEDQIHSRYHGSFFQFYPYFFANMHLSWSVASLASISFHLWFLAILFLASMLSLPFFLYMKHASCQQFLHRLAITCNRDGGLFILVLPIALLQITLQLSFPGYLGWADVFSWLAFFLYGYILISDPQFLHAIKKQAPLIVPAGIACILIFLALYSTGLIDTWGNATSYSIGYVFYQFLCTIMIWTWVMIVLYVSMRFLNFNNRIIHYANEAVLPFYILHYPVVVVTAFSVAQYTANSTLRFLLTSTISLALTLVLYDRVIRSTAVMRWLFTMPPLQQPNSRKPVRQVEQKRDADSHRRDKSI